MVEDARYPVRYLEQRQLTTFTKRDLFQGTKSWFKQVIKLDPALRLLLDHRYVFEMSITAQARVGRPASPMYEVHPALLGGDSAARCTDPEIGLEDFEDSETDVSVTSKSRYLEDNEVFF